MIKICMLGLLWYLGVVSCSTGFNPLDDYKQLEPATNLPTQEPADTIIYPAEEVAHGKYLVTLLGCSICHTDGALVGEPDLELVLAGSRTGIAYSNPLVEKNPGVVYPSNITPDLETGIGSWSLDQIITMIRAGTKSHGGQSIPVMPFPEYAKIEMNDAHAIAVYLKSLAPVAHKVPANVAPGQRATAPFVHFGVYQSK
jgi:hypothetical protein